MPSSGPGYLMAWGSGLLALVAHCRWAGGCVGVLSKPFPDDLGGRSLVRCHLLQGHPMVVSQ